MMWNSEAESRNEIKEMVARYYHEFKENKTQTVLKMFRRNMPVEDIADISELSVEEVKDILKNASIQH